MNSGTSRLALWALWSAVVTATAAIHPVLGLALLALTLLSLGDDTALVGAARPVTKHRPTE